MLIKLLKENSWDKILVFVKTQHTATRLIRHFDEKKIKAAAIHGKKSQSARNRALSDFKGGNIQVLVATDLASRGLDINELPCVINYDLPHVAENYIHRIGRTGRAGQPGLAISFLCADEFKELVAIEQYIQKHLKRVNIEEFLPVNIVPDSPIIKPLKAKKPKKKKNKS